MPRPRGIRQPAPRGATGATGATGGRGAGLGRELLNGQVVD